MGHTWPILCYDEKQLCEVVEQNNARRAYTCLNVMNPKFEYYSALLTLLRDCTRSFPEHIERHLKQIRKKTGKEGVGHDCPNFKELWNAVNNPQNATEVDMVKVVLEGIAECAFTALATQFRSEEAQLLFNEWVDYAKLGQRVNGHKFKHTFAHVRKVKYLGNEISAVTLVLWGNPSNLKDIFTNVEIEDTTHYSEETLTPSCKRLDEAFLKAHEHKSVE